MMATHFTEDDYRDKNAPDLPEPQDIPDSDPEGHNPWDGESLPF